MTKTVLAAALFVIARCAAPYEDPVRVSTAWSRIDFKPYAASEPHNGLGARSAPKPTTHPAKRARGYQGPRLSLGPGAPAASSISDVERQRLVAHLDMTERWLTDEVSALSPAQLTFRTGQGRWTIMEVIDHLVVVGPIYWQDLQKALKAPPSGRIAPERDADILWYGIDRTAPQKAIPSEEPKGAVRDAGAGLQAYRKQTAQLRQFAKTTAEDLRSHFVEREGCDAYQWALLISTHAQRHILQIREIKADSRFPKK